MPKQVGPQTVKVGALGVIAMTDFARANWEASLTGESAYRFLGLTRPGTKSAMSRLACLPEDLFKRRACLCELSPAKRVRSGCGWNCPVSLCFPCKHPPRRISAKESMPILGALFVWQVPHSGEHDADCRHALHNFWGQVGPDPSSFAGTHKSRHMDFEGNPKPPRPPTKQQKKKRGAYIDWQANIRWPSGLFFSALRQSHQQPRKSWTGTPASPLVAAKGLQLPFAEVVTWMRTGTGSTHQHSNTLPQHISAAHKHSSAPMPHIHTPKQSIELQESHATQ